MTRVTSLVAAASLAATVAAGSLSMLSAPARAATLHMDCRSGDCVRTRCHDDGMCSTLSTHQHRALSETRASFANKDRPLLRACDRDGANCRMTRDYFVDAEGRTRLYENYPALYQ